MADLEERHEAILNNVSLIVVKESKLSTLFKVLRNLFNWNKEKEIQ